MHVMTISDIFHIILSLPVNACKQHFSLDITMKQIHLTTRGSYPFAKMLQLGGYPNKTNFTHKTSTLVGGHNNAPTLPTNQPSPPVDQIEDFGLCFNGRQVGMFSFY